METTVLAVYFFLMNSFTPAPKAFRKGKTEPNHSWKWEYVGQMPSTVKESSGLAFIDGFVYTHGDSGQKSELWKFSLENLKEIKKFQFLIIIKTGKTFALSMTHFIFRMQGIT